MDQTFDIVIEQLMTDEEFRQAFLRNPRRALTCADEWGLPLCDSEIRALLANGPAVWSRLATELYARLEYAA